ncbi:MAG TPA: hypothetical protein VL742_08455 [Casimicrobiaceae bacterium]|nr:hypothetical protein [Casimicrobiaceae bacterium]
MGKTEKKNHASSLTGPLVVAAALFASQPLVAVADPASKVHLPDVVQGELELELLGGYQWWSGADDDRERQFIGEIEYGFTPWWRSGLEVGTTRAPGESYRLDEVEWENTFLLSEPGRYWLDLGLFAELAYDYPVRRSAIAIGPMFQKEIGALQSNLNVIFERELGSSAQPGAEINYEWQVKWRGNPRFEPGLQSIGTLGRTNDFGHQMEVNIGPAFFGQIFTSPRNKLKYDAAVLFGVNHNSPDTTVRFQIEYELY